MNGVGSSVDRFSIMLYPAGCTGGMVANLCDKPSIGCKDSSKFFYTTSTYKYIGFNLCLPRWASPSLTNPFTAVCFCFDSCCNTQLNQPSSVHESFRAGHL